MSKLNHQSLLLWIENVVNYNFLLWYLKFRTSQSDGGGSVSFEIKGYRCRSHVQYRTQGICKYQKPKQNCYSSDREKNVGFQITEIITKFRVLRLFSKLVKFDIILALCTLWCKKESNVSSYYSCIWFLSVLMVHHHYSDC